MAIREYSEKEQALFAALGIGHLCEVIDNPPNLYRIAVEQAFVADAKGPAVESLRRCYAAYMSCKIYRGTPDWDAMIQLD